MAETTRVLITDDDVVTATTAATDDNGEGPWAHEVRDALEAIASRLRARWVAEALDEAAGQIAARCGHRDYRHRGGDTFEERWAPPKIWPADVCPFCSKDTELVRTLAAEYRAGTR